MTEFKETLGQSIGWLLKNGPHDGLAMSQYLIESGVVVNPAKVARLEACGVNLITEDVARERGRRMKAENERDALLAQIDEACVEAEQIMTKVWTGITGSPDGIAHDGDTKPDGSVAVAKLRAILTKGNPHD